MWFFGFSTTESKIVGAILLVILLTMVLKRWAIRLEAAHPEKESCYMKNVQRKLGADHHHHHQKCQLEICKRSTSWSLMKCCCCHGDDHVIRTYALEELRGATKDFRCRIGVGATSFVYLAELGDGTFGAVKRVMQERGGSKKMFLDEVSVLLRISHPNLVGLMGFCMEKGEQLLLLEYVPNQSLFDRIHTYRGQSSGVLTWSNRLSIALDIARALDYLHSEADPPIIHRDIKSSNILLIDDDHAKLADFGLCKLGHTKHSQQVSPTNIKGSFGYIDANYVKTGHVSPKSDVYSFGVLLLELITGLKSMQGPETLAEWTEECRQNEDVKVLMGILDPKLNGNANQEQLRVLISLANSALLENSEARPDMSQIVDRISSCIEPRLHPELPV